MGTNSCRKCGGSGGWPTSCTKGNGRSSTDNDFVYQDPNAEDDSQADDSINDTDYDPQGIEQLEARLATETWEDCPNDIRSLCTSVATIKQTDLDALKRYNEGIKDPTSKPAQEFVSKLKAKNIDLDEIYTKLIEAKATLEKLANAQGEATTHANAMQTKLKILQEVKDAAVSRNTAAYKVKRNARKPANKANIQKKHKASRYNHKMRAALYKNNEKILKAHRINEDASVEQMVKDAHVAGRDQYKDFRPSNSFKGWFSGNGHEVVERERLAFTNSCVTCKNTGCVPAPSKKTCIYPPTKTMGWQWGNNHAHSCMQPCSDCRPMEFRQVNDKDEVGKTVEVEFDGVWTKAELVKRYLGEDFMQKVVVRFHDDDEKSEEVTVPAAKTRTKHVVYIRKKLLNHKTKTPIGVGTKCVLMAIAGKSFDRVPRAAIKIGDMMYHIDTSDISLLSPGIEKNRAAERARKAAEREATPTEMRRLPTYRSHESNGSQGSGSRLSRRSNSILVRGLPQLSRNPTEELMNELERADRSTTRSIDRLNPAEVEEAERELHELDENQRPAGEQLGGLIDDFEMSAHGGAEPVMKDDTAPAVPNQCPTCGGKGTVSCKQSECSNKYTGMLFLMPHPCAKGECKKACPNCGGNGVTRNAVPVQVLQTTGPQPSPAELEEKRSEVPRSPTAGSTHSGKARSGSLSPRERSRSLEDGPKDGIGSDRSPAHSYHAHPTMLYRSPPIDLDTTQHRAEPDTNDDQRSQTRSRSTYSPKSESGRDLLKMGFEPQEIESAEMADCKDDLQGMVEHILKRQEKASEHSSPKSKSGRILQGMEYGLQEIESAERAVSESKDVRVNAMIEYIDRRQKDASEHSKGGRGTSDDHIFTMEIMDRRKGRWSNSPVSRADVERLSPKRSEAGSQDRQS